MRFRRKPKVEVWTPVGSGFYYLAPPRWRVWLGRAGWTIIIGVMALGAGSVLLFEVLPL